MKKSKIIKIGVVLHPLNIEDFKDKFLAFYQPYSYFLLPFLFLIKPYFLKQIYAKFPPHRIFQTNKIIVHDKEFQIIAVMCPLFPEQLVSQKDNAVQRIHKAVQLLSKSEAKIVTLAGFSSIITGGGYDILSDVSCSITSGNSLTAALAVDGVEKAVAVRGLKLEDLKFAIIGATGDIGSVCAKFFAKKVKELILCSRNVESDELFRNEILSQRPKGVLFTVDLDVAINDADVLIVATSAFGYLLDPSKLKKNAIVCDVSMPPNVSRNSKTNRPDIFVFNGGRASLPFFDRIKSKAWNKLFPRNSVYGCLAEGIALALDNQFISYSLGKRQITLEKLEEIKGIAFRNGIVLAEQGFGVK